MIDEASNPNLFAKDEYPMKASFVVAAVVAVVELFDDCVEPFEVADAYYCLT
jgi:hypothetical protein